MRILIRHRTAEPVPLFWVVAALVGVVLGVAADLILGWIWWSVTVGWLVLVWLVFLATAFRHPGREDLWIDLVATISPQRARQLDLNRLLRLMESAPGRAYGLLEWEGPRQIGGYGRSSTDGLTHLELIYGSPIDGPQLRVNTIWKRSSQPHISIEEVRSRLTRELWHRQLHPPDDLDGAKRHSWMRTQRIDIDQRSIPDWTATSISFEEATHPAAIHREGADWVAVIETDPAMIEIESRQIPIDHLALTPIADFTTYTYGPPR